MFTRSTLKICTSLRSTLSCQQQLGFRVEDKCYISMHLEQHFHCIVSDFNRKSTDEHVFSFFLPTSIENLLMSDDRIWLSQTLIWIIINHRTKTSSSLEFLILAIIHSNILSDKSQRTNSFEWQILCRILKWRSCLIGFLTGPSLSIHWLTLFSRRKVLELLKSSCELVDSFDSIRFDEG